MLGGVGNFNNNNNSIKYYTTTTTGEFADENGHKTRTCRVIETRRLHQQLQQEKNNGPEKAVENECQNTNNAKINGNGNGSASPIRSRIIVPPVSVEHSVGKRTLHSTHPPIITPRRRTTNKNIGNGGGLANNTTMSNSGNGGVGGRNSVAAPPAPAPEKVYAPLGIKFKVIDKEGKEIPRKPGQPEIQNYENIKAECLKTKKLFVDEEFPAQDSSLFYSEAERIYGIEWKRPGELSKNPKFFIDGFSRFDVNQGELGNCWFLAAVANLTLHENIFMQVVPKDNSFVNDYTGAFHFRFWHYGCWVDVVVDDLLPCRRGTGELVFMHSFDKDEFWSALLEKAYAKLYGSYQALSGGTATEALQDFTGGLIETIKIKDTKLDVFGIMEKAQERQSFMGCSLTSIDPSIKEGKTSQGLVRGHAYSITKVQKVDISTPNKSGKIPLVRIRNPWGNEFEWKGAWSDGSREWEFVSDAVKQKLGISFTADGEFWMSLKDFKEQFDMLEICYLSPDSLVSIPKTINVTNTDAGREVEIELKREWNTNVFEGKWTPGATSGGCANYIANEPKTFAHNPQYIVNVDRPSNNDNAKSMVLVALMQKHRRAKRKEGAGSLSIGFAVYKLKDPDTTPNPLDLNYFRYNAMVDDSGDYINSREVSGRFELPPGSYCIIPSTFQPNQDGDFMIRVFSENYNSMKENNGDIAIGTVDRNVEKKSNKNEAETSDGIQKLFKMLGGDDLEIGWTKLKLLLDSYLKKEYNLPGLSREVCRSMVAMFDADRTGKLGLEEFTTLWKNISIWMSCFKIFDADNSGNLNSLELRAALGSIGFQVNNSVLAAITLRFGDENGNISLEDFIMVAVKLKSLIESYKEKDPEGSNQAVFSLEQWVEKTIYS